jgi:hypothetical protein
MHGDDLTVVVVVVGTVLVVVKLDVVLASMGRVVLTVVIVEVNCGHVHDLVW